MTFVLFFWYQTGLSPGGALGYFGIYFALCIAMTRMRAELGPPTHELHGMHPDRLLILFLDTRPLGATNLTNTTLLSWLAYGYRCHPMPHQLKAFKIGLHFKYRFARWGVGEFYRLQNWIAFPSLGSGCVERQVGVERLVKRSKRRVCL